MMSLSRSAFCHAVCVCVCECIVGVACKHKAMGWISNVSALSLLSKVKGVKSSHADVDVSVASYFLRKCVNEFPSSSIKHLKQEKVSVMGEYVGHVAIKNIFKMFQSLAIQLFVINYRNDRCSHREDSVLRECCCPDLM